MGTLAHLALEQDIRDLETLAGFDVSLPKEYVNEALQLAQRFDQVAELYYRLIIVPCDVCGGQSDRTQKINFQQIVDSSNNRYIKIN
ncbi:MAG: hypothetical protein HWQ41_27970 [Nostoc sp. NOS(2021)]|uniref:hypothetical protein n=1 Tax=Nostoc sp. NOS(2021) TaxID=2815407 RepID=UPI0025FCD98A|nr:hypothetical protein [Nostoc sp. NOS(2021)]MBN3898968.1 hypothetical protein [Nostoc sp. NOS(2021)]